LLHSKNENTFKSTKNFTMSDSKKDDLPNVCVTRLVFSDGNSIALGSTDVVLLVGSNNSGKSATLRAIRDKLHDAANVNPVLGSLVIEKRGSVESLEAWISKWTSLKNGNNFTVYSGLGTQLPLGQARYFWTQSDNALANLSQFFCRVLLADDRLQLCLPPQNIPLTTSAPTHPIHHLQRDADLELSLSAKFRKAFGVDLVVHRNAGSQVPLHVGVRPMVLAGEDRISPSYQDRLEKLPQLQEQGDGMRSFAGILLATAVGRESMFLIDEPEAFLHPPQARLLGTSLVQDRGDNRQLFIATHSTDVLRGVLDANSPDVKVIRIRRDGNVNAVHLLDNARIKEFWSDPLLRYSNILDGLFHEGVVVCEADSDCRFYSAVFDADYESQEQETKRPDLMFTHCGGKHRLPLVVRALREVDVPVRVVADFDVLSEEQPLRGIVEVLGVEWTRKEADWKIVKSSIDSKRPDLNCADAKKEIDAIFKKILTTTLPETTRSELQKILKKTSAWANAKAVGKSFVPSGDPSKACERLLTALRAAGLYVVEVGELEGFAKTEAGHGPKWVNSVLARDLAKDVELEGARKFTRELVSSFEVKA
jgi:AAA domain, putative AbiEii toxin, Type IV TA system